MSRSDLCVTCGYWVATIGNQCEACGGDPAVNLQGPTWCEKHPQTIWPHGDCAGPGMWVTNGTLRQWHVVALVEVESLQAEVRNLWAKLDHYDSWFGDDCRCGEDPCPLVQP